VGDWDGLGGVNRLAAVTHILVVDACSGAQMAAETWETKQGTCCGTGTCLIILSQVVVVVLSLRCVCLLDV
jgi:hypothetical protein